jgi:hypothetical protein
MTVKTPPPSIAVPVNSVAVPVSERPAKLQLEFAQPGPLKTTVALFGSKPLPVTVYANACPLAGGFGDVVIVLS